MEFQFDKNIEIYEGKSYYITAHEIIIDNFEKKNIILQLEIKEPNLFIIRY